jgi:hypothetical protein
MISMTTAQRSLRLQSYRSSELTTLTFTKGEVFYDADLKTLRIYDGVTGGGAVVATNSTITTALVPYSTTTQMNSAISTALGGYVTSTGLTTTLNSYSTTTQMNSAISTALGGYVSSSSLSTTLSGYITSSSLTTTLNGYTTTAANALNAPIANPTFTGKITAPTAIVGGVNIKAFAIAMGAALA